MNRAEQIKKALGIVGTLFFGTDQERDAQAEELAQAADEKLVERRHRRAINSPADGSPPAYRRERER